MINGISVEQMCTGHVNELFELWEKQFSEYCSNHDMRTIHADL